jgi:ribosomal protein RSM22 (predicted rRNA methylase)
MQNAKKLKQDEKKIVLAYATLKLKANRLNKELDSMKEHVVNLFDRTNQNLVIVQDEHGNSFGLQKINRVRKSFDKDKFKLSHLDLWNAHQKPTSLADMVVDNGQKKQLNYEIMFQLLMGECEKHILENVGNPVVDEFKDNVLKKFSTLVQAIHNNE